MKPLAILWMLLITAVFSPSLSAVDVDYITDVVPYIQIWEKDIESIDSKIRETPALKDLTDLELAGLRIKYKMSCKELLRIMPTPQQCEEQSYQWETETGITIYVHFSDYLDRFESRRTTMHPPRNSETRRIIAEHQAIARHVGPPTLLVDQLRRTGYTHEQLILAEDVAEMFSRRERLASELERLKSFQTMNGSAVWRYQDRERRGRIIGFIPGKSPEPFDRNSGSQMILRGTVVFEEETSGKRLRLSVHKFSLPDRNQLRNMIVSHYLIHQRLQNLSPEPNPRPPRILPPPKNSPLPKEP